jgi:hypothetical protein
MAHRLGQHDASAAPAALSDEQFSELKALLQPGFELATLMLEDYKRQREFAMADHSGDNAAAVADDGTAQS